MIKEDILRLIQMNAAFEQHQSKIGRPEENEGVFSKLLEERR
jgi:hypothetical protein